MNAVKTILFDQKKNEHFVLHGNYEPEDHVKDVKQYMNHDAFLQNVLAIFATTGMEPEEEAMRHNLSPYAVLKQYAPPDPDERTSGIITFESIADQKLHSIHVHVAFGFIRKLLCKSVLLEYESAYYVAVQAGGDDFWMGYHLAEPKANSKDLVKLCDEEEKNFLKYNGAPRNWSSGMKQIETQEALQIIESWRNSFDIKNLQDRDAAQLEIAKKALYNIAWTSKTFMIDAYRDGVSEGIRELIQNGKQFFICTGDALKPAQVIAKQIQLPEQQLVMDGTSEQTLFESLKRAEKAAEHAPCTLFFDQACMDTLQIVEEREGGFHGPLFDMLLYLLEEREHEMYLHCAVFCRATPALKPWCVKLAQTRYAKTVLQSIFGGRHYVLAMGDGANGTTIE